MTRRGFLWLMAMLFLKPNTKIISGSVILWTPEYLTIVDPTGDDWP